MAERDAASVRALRKEAASAHAQAGTERGIAQRALARADEYQRVADAAVAKARAAPSGADVKMLSDALWREAQAARLWKHAYELRSHETDARREAADGFAKALRCEERRAALLNGVAVINHGSRGKS